VTVSFSKLTTMATGLNAVSDELGKSVAQVDSALKNLNIGIPVWVPIKSWDGGEMDDYEYWSEDIGYSKINGKWGISIRRVEGNHRNPDRETTEAWLFGDAPRALRLEAIDRIPDLLEKMTDQAAFAIQKIHSKLADVQAVAAAVTPKPSAKKRTLLQAIGESQVAVVGLKPTPEFGTFESGTLAASENALGLDSSEGENALGITSPGVKK